jgi:hypothetical protein
VTDAERRWLYLRAAIVAGTIAGMAWTHKLWLSARFYPLTPVFPFLKPIPPPFDAVLFGATLLALVLSAWTPRLIPFFATLALILAVCDLSRLQPWFYLFFFLLLGVAFSAPNACRLMAATFYFWSGAQNLNASFMRDVFPRFLDPFLRHLPSGAAALVHPLSVAAPFLELWIGIALLGRKFRPPAVIAAVAIHLLIVIANPRGVAWVWNLTMAAAVVILFWKTGESARHILLGRNPFHIAVLFLFGLAPVLSFFGYWVRYNGNETRGTIFVTEKLFAKLPSGIARYARVETPEVRSIDIADWSADELKVPPYPEVRIYKSVARSICRYADTPSDARLSVVSKSTVGSRVTGSSYTCAALQTP